ncbi:unnamed protein product [Rhizopus stolonifer]
MKLIDLPKELLQAIAQHLSREYLAHLCLSCKWGYQIFLPLLYKHVTLSHRTQIKQLEQGLENNEYLQQVAREYTLAVTFSFRQGSNENFWKTILERLPNTRRLYFRGYMSLSVKKIQQVLSVTPKVSLLDIEYCELIHPGEQVVFHNVTSLNLMWTDFSLEAAQGLFQSIPHLRQVTLGANHNRKPLDNDTALQILQTICLGLQRLTISLQQVKESTLCALLALYGPQLEQLSIRCEGSQSMKNIADYAKGLQHLVIRHSGCEKNDITNILRECASLSHFEMVSWPIQEVPMVVLDRMKLPQMEGIRKTFALDRNDLQEIRRLCLYQE